MNLLDELKKINGLNGKTELRIICTDDIIVEGFYRGYTSAYDNDPGIPQLDILSNKNDGLIGILEDEIKSVSLI